MKIDNKNNIAILTKSLSVDGIIKKNIIAWHIDDQAC